MVMVVWVEVMVHITAFIENLGADRGQRVTSRDCYTV